MTSSKDSYFLCSAMITPTVNTDYMTHRLRLIDEPERHASSTQLDSFAKTGTTDYAKVLEVRAKALES